LTVLRLAPRRLGGFRDRHAAAFMRQFRYLDGQFRQVARHDLLAFDLGLQALLLPLQGAQERQSKGQVVDHPRRRPR
jgi:hypothetical protein